MTDGDFPFRSFTMRSEGYDRGEVDSYVEELRGEITELRRALETATPSNDGDTRLHDPEGAVTRTLAIAQETADRVLHDAQVEADRRRVEADEHSTMVIAEADERAARLLGEMETQAAEVREQGVAAARSAIQVERDKAMAELAHVRRVRDDLRTEAVDLKAALDRYRSQAREASDTLSAAASGPLMSLDLPDFIDDDVVLAGISSATDNADADMAEPAGFGDLDDMDIPDPVDTEIAWEGDAEDSDLEMPADDDSVSYLRAVDDDADDVVEGEWVEGDQTDADALEVEAIDADYMVVDDGGELDMGEFVDESADDLADVIELDADADDDGLGGTFLAEVRAAAVDDDVALAPEGDDSDRFLSELRGITEDAGESLDSDAADTFFDDEG